MAMKRTLKVPMAVGPSFDLKIDSFDWKIIEGAYGREIPDPARQKFLEATQTHLLLTGFENSAEPMQRSVDRVNDLISEAQTFRRKLLEGDWKSSSRYYADHLVKLNFSSHFLVAPHAFHGLIGVLASFVSACEIALLEMQSDMQVRSPSEGNGWKIWIAQLTITARNFKLPHAVPTDNGANSPFVRLVIALQDHLPETFRRPYHSEDALAKAIQRARAASKGDMNRSKAPP